MPQVQILQAINQQTQDYLSLLRAIYEYHRSACEIIPRNHPDLTYELPHLFHLIYSQCLAIAD